MVLKFLLSLFFSSLLCLSSYACEYRMGDVYINNSKFDCINVLGQLNLQNSSALVKVNVGGTMVIGNSSVFGDTVVNGKINASSSNITNLNVTGTCDLSGGYNHILGSVDITGILMASNTLFDKQIFITSSLINFNNKTNTKGIHVRENSSSPSEKQFIYIDNSIVDGDIIFDGNSGSVILSNGAKLLGKVSGGVVIYK